MSGLYSYEIIFLGLDLMNLLFVAIRNRLLQFLGKLNGKTLFKKFR